MHMAVKRIITDLLQLEKTPIPNTHICFDEANIKLIKLVIIGPDDTPYEGGFYIFELQFPNDYPKNPPVVKFLTTNGTTRFNPNLYENGTVCLSILNTWSGPKWSAIMSLSCIIVNLQSILCKYPIRNEPGYDNLTPDDSRSIKYSNIVEYWNWKFAIAHVLQSSVHAELNNYILDYYKKNITKYTDKFNKISSTSTRKMTYSMYNIHETIDYNSIELP